jgi:ATP-dependent DNA ligase
VLFYLRCADPEWKGCHGRDLDEARELIEEQILPEPIRYSPILDATLQALVRSVKAQHLEGLVAKRRNGKYESGLRSGAWQKMRVNQGQGFVIGGYTLSPKNFDALFHRVLRRRQADLCREDAERIHSSLARRTVQEA